MRFGQIKNNRYVRTRITNIKKIGKEGAGFPDFRIE
jgi:hypothetical protein